MARSWLDRLWSSIADRGGAWVDIPDASPLEQVCRLAHDLLSGRGEASGAAIARELLTRYNALSRDDRIAFMQFLAENFTPEEAKLRDAAQAYLADPSAERAMRLAQVAEPPRQELIRRINMGQGGTATLVAMRRDLLAALRTHPELKPLNADLQHLLASWFNRGFLKLQRIDWDSSAAVLEKLINYEAVHEITGWPDLQRRLERDRRCFGFFHPALPGEPLIFVEVALLSGIATRIEPLLALGPDVVGDVKNADTAIFYSINNCQDGLRGISFGNFLIKQVVEELRTEFPSLACFATLSPVPGFRRWLESNLAETSEFLLPAERTALAPFAGEDLSALPAFLSTNWADDPTQRDALMPPLLRLCATYLTAARDGSGPNDPVARFHLGNGARLERINWLANSSRRGMAESCGIMVNYLYDPDTIETNHEAFVRQGAVAHSTSVAALLQSGAAAKRASRLSSLVPNLRSRTALPAT
jgi:malonyl-CoA decarboxylase